MIEELEDFLRHCRIERRLAPLTCSAYERDVRACQAFLSGEAIVRSPLSEPALFVAAEARGLRRVTVSQRRS